MAKAKFDITTLEIPAAAARPLYAGVGASDIAYTAVKEYVADVQKKLTGVQKDVTTKVADVQKSVTGFEPKSVRKQAVDAVAARRSAVEARVADLQADAMTLPTRVQTAVNENVAMATATYADLAKRGEVVVTRIRKQQPTVGVEVKTTPTKTVAAKATATRKSTPRNAPARKVPTKKAGVKKAAAKKANS